MTLVGLWARRCRKQLLVLLALLAAGDAAVFMLALRRFPGGPLEQIMGDGPFTIAAACTVTALTMLLAGAAADNGARPDYTLRRLALSERKAFFCRAAHNTLCYFLFWGVQLALIALLCLLWRTRFPGAWEKQTLLLAFYRVPFLHNLLPLGDWYVAKGAANIAQELSRRGYTGEPYQFHSEPGKNYETLRPILCLEVGSKAESGNVQQIYWKRAWDSMERRERGLNEKLNGLPPFMGTTDALQPSIAELFDQLHSIESEELPASAPNWLEGDIKL